MGHAGTFVEINDSGLSVAAELALGGAGRVAGLQRMSAAQVLAALSAMATVDIELACDGLTWNLGLELLIEMVFDNVAAACRTAFGQRSFKGFIHRAGRRAMAVVAVLLALFATRLFRVFLGWAFGKGSGLPFGGPFSLTQWIALALLLPGIYLVVRPSPSSPVQVPDTAS